MVEGVPKDEEPAAPEGKRVIAEPGAAAASKGTPLLLGVRMFLYGSQQHLSMYDLSRLSEVTDSVGGGATRGAPGGLAQIVDCYRPSAFYVGGLDAVAIGLLAAGDRNRPVPYALRTFTARPRRPTQT